MPPVGFEPTIPASERPQTQKRADIFIKIKYTVKNASYFL
jgi:hypothetical protein